MDLVKENPKLLLPSNMLFQTGSERAERGRLIGMEGLVLALNRGPNGLSFMQRPLGTELLARFSALLCSADCKPLKGK